MRAPGAKELADGVWAVEDSLSLGPGMALPLRMTALRARDGSLVVIAPVKNVQRWGPALAAHGAVAAVVAPSGFHHLFALEAAAAFPSAHLVASAALRDKRTDFPASTTWLIGDVPIAVAPGIAALPVLGMPEVQEWVLFAEDSGTLVVTDLLFHLTEPGFVLGLALRVFGTYRRLAVSRFFLRARTDRAAFSASLEAIAALPMERLVMAHGTPILAGAGARTREALARAP